MKTSSVYLLHFDKPISSKHTAQHYIGWASNLEKRIAKHRTNPDARLLQVALERGIGFQVVRVWTGGRKLERQLKRLKNGRKLCPLCTAQRSSIKSDVDFFDTDLAALRSGKVKRFSALWTTPEEAIGQYESTQPYLA